MRSRGGLKAAKGSRTAAAQPAKEVEELECLTCTEVMTYFADCRCNHRVVCARCSIKMRSFSHRFNCIICKEEQHAVVITKDQEKKFEDYNLGILRYRSDKKGGKHRTYFADEDAQRVVEEALGYSCAKCGSGFTSMRLLRTHLREAHGLQFCTVCVENLKMFISEQKLYTRAELKQHIQGTKDANGEQQGGHPYCEFCGKPFLDSDALWQHMEKEHVACHVCAREEETYQYFKDYKSLEEHFDKAHYLCPDPMCREQRNIVFSTALDLKAHTIAVHLSSRNMSQSEKKKAYSLDLWTSDMPLRGGHGREQRSRRGGRPDAGPGRSRREERQRVEAKQEEEEEEDDDVNDVVLHVPRTKEELRERNKQVMSAVKEALAGKDGGMEKLKALSRDFKNGRLSAAEYHKRFLSLFGTTNGIPIFLDLAALLPDVKQRSDLLQAHIEWKDIRSNYPQVGAEPPPASATARSSQGSGRGPSAAGQEVAAATPSSAAPVASEANFPTLGGGPPPGLSIAGAAVYAARGRPVASDFPALVSAAPSSAAAVPAADELRPAAADWGAQAPDTVGKKKRKKKNQKVTLFSTGIRYN